MFGASSSSALADTTTEETEAALEAARKVAEALAAGNYVPSPVDGPGPEVYIGLVAGVVPFAIGSWEFGKRIVSLG